MLNKVLRWGITGLIFLMPLFFLPLTTEFYDFNKNLLLIFVTLLLLAVWAGRMALEKKLVFCRTVFDLPIIVILLANLASLIFASTNKIEALTTPGGTGTVIALTILYFLITNTFTANFRPLVISLMASASVLSLATIYQFIGVGEAFIPAGQGMDFLRAKSFSPSGNPFSTAVFLAVIFIIASYQLYSHYKTSKDQQSPVPDGAGQNSQSRFNPALLLHSLSIILIIAGLGVTIFQLLTSARVVFLPQFTGWVVALEAFKNFPFLGVGVENFLSAFTAGKPIGFNTSQFWSAQFGLSSNFYFQALTTLGIIGLGAWIYLILKVIKTNISHEDVSSRWGLIFIFVLLALFPAPYLLMFTLYLSVSLFAIRLPNSVAQKESKNLTAALFAGAALLALISFYIFGRVFAADYYFRQSLAAASLNRGGDTYNLQVKAIQINPYSDLYHLAYSQTNLALANSIAAKKDLTDSDKQSINQLIQQSIAEAKAAINLAPSREGNWENLAVIYRNLINIAQGADSWSVAAYNQAIILDPINPNLRLSLGGIYFGAKNYDEAIRQFGFAVNLKPDLANAHYNLAVAYQGKDDLKNAIAELQQAQLLVVYDSNDYKTLSKEITDLQAKLPPEPTATASGTPETLTPPATPLPEIKPPIKLPKEAAPPATSSAEPSPSASPEATASPSATPK